MTPFYQKFLRDKVYRELMGSGHEIHLAAFGKHPGWDDHIEDIGLATDSLILAKQLLYLQGIGGQIDVGAWEKLLADQQLPRFHHLFVWQRSGRYLLGRLWSSTDGKGRSRYPMVVCAQPIGLPLDWAAAQVLPELERMEQACHTARLANEVEGIVSHSLETLRQHMILPPLSTLMNSPEPWHARPEWGKEAFGRTLHQFREQIVAFQEASQTGTGDYSQVKPQQIRVPLAAGSIPEAILLWEQFVYRQIAADIPALFLIPLEAPWIDITLGEPGSEEFFCLRATPKTMPLASQIPYHLKPDNEGQCGQMIDAMRHIERPWRIAGAAAPKEGLGNRLSSLFAGKARKVMKIVRGETN